MNKNCLWTNFIFYFRALTAAVTLLFTALVPLNASAAGTLAEIFSEGQAYGELRLYSFTTDYSENTPDANDNAVGGIVYLRTAEVKGISFGATLGIAEDFFSDDDKDSFKLLQENHDGYRKFLEAYVQGHWFDTTIKYGAQIIYTPYADIDPGRFLPKTYKGLSLINKSIRNLELHAYYITDFSDWCEDWYRPVGTGMNANNYDDPLYIGGFKYRLETDPVNVEFEAWGYNLRDTFNLGFLRMKAEKQIGDLSLFFMPSYTVQKSIGDETSGKIDTYEIGFETGFKYAGLELKGFLSKSGDDDLATPWGPGGRVIKQEERISGFAEMDAYAVRMEYNFSSLSLPGLTAAVYYADYDSPYAYSDSKETNYVIRYNFGKEFNKALEGVSVELTYADVDFEHSEDFKRTDLRIKFPFSFTKL